MDDSLRKLIKGLSASEKRYFRLYAQRSGDGANHLALFEVLVKDPSVTDNDVRQRHRSEKWALNLPVTKNHLKHQILDALVHFGRENGYRNTIEHGIRKATMLHDHDCTADAVELLNKLEKRAADGLFWSSALQAVQFLKAIQYGDGIDINRQLLAREQQYLNYMLNESAYYALIRELLNIRLGSGLVSSEAERTRLEELRQHALVTDMELAITPIAKYYFHTFWGICHSLLLDSDASEQSYLRSLELARDVPALAAGRIKDYFSRLNSYVSKLSAKGFTPVFNEWMKELRSAPTTPMFKDLMHVKELTTVYSATHELQAYFHEHSFGQGAKRADELWAEVTAAFEPVKEPFRLVFLYNGMVLHVMAGEYQTSKRWIRAILEMPGEASMLTRQLASLLNIMVRYELGDLELVESLLRSQKRDAQGLGSATAQRLFRHYGELLRVDSSESNKLWAKLDSDFSELCQKPEEKPLFALFDFGAWTKQFKV
jgi:hypothetical protein